MLPDLEFVHYSGSLTVFILILLIEFFFSKTPPCVEVIEWFIMRHPLEMSILE